MCQGMEDSMGCKCYHSPAMVITSFRNLGLNLHQKKMVLLNPHIAESG